MPPPIAIDEDLTRRLPLPLAQLYRRAHNAREPFPRHQAAYYLWEAALKLLGAAAVLAYAEQGRRDPKVVERLRHLDRPSLGHWLDYCNTLIPILAAAGDEPFLRLKEIFHGPARSDLGKVAELDASLRKLFKQAAPARGPVRLRELFDRLVRYRNDELGHGAAGMRQEAFYDGMANSLLEALPELFRTLDVLAGRRLVYVSDVSRNKSGQWVVEHLELIGEIARRVEPLRVDDGDRGALPVPERVYLLRPTAESAAAAAPSALEALRSLHPLVLYNEATRGVYFLNTQRNQDQVEYLEYLDGTRLDRDDLAGAQQEFLAKILGTPVDPPAVKPRIDQARGETEEAPPPHEAPDPGPQPAPVPALLRPNLRVMLLYKRHAQPDERLLRWLEAEFTARGAEVFVDRHMQIGVEWAKELERRVREADAIVLLLSAASVHSEMLAYEVQLAHEESQKREGKPRLFPVRIDFEGQLPTEMAGILDRLQYFLWKGPQDDTRLLEELLGAMNGAPPALDKLPPPGGALPVDYQNYVVRPTDAEFQSAIDRQDSVVLIRGARQMGKTSLLARGLRQAREQGVRVAVTDLQMLNAANLATVDVFFRTLGQWIADALDLEVSPDEIGETGRGPSANFERFMRRKVLTTDAPPLVWAIDEADRLFSCDFGSEVFGLFRYWHNARALQPVWSRLTLVIAYATEAHLFISDLNQSPFNIGTPVSLEDFTADQVGWLNGRYGAPLRDGAEVAQFHKLVGGQPYLVNRGLYQMVQRGLRAAAFQGEAAKDDGVFGDHLRRILVLLARDEKLCDVVRGVLRGRPCPTPESFYRLRSAGLVAGESAREARMRCELYGKYLERHLL